MKIRRLILPFLSVLLVAALLSGCGAQEELQSAGNAAVYDSGAENGDVSLRDETLSSGTQSSTTAQPTNQKLIRTVSLEAETEDMDALLTDVESRISQLGGYVETRNVYNGKTTYRESRWADLTIRIPADKLDQFVTQVSDVSNITAHNETTKDVTLSYVATESRITALETEETRLLELMGSAKDLKDLLTLEEKLTDVRTELEQHKSQLKLYDNQVSYATVHLSVKEVVQYTEVEEPEAEPTFWQRLGDGFVTGVKNVWALGKGLVILTVSLIPYLVIPAAVVIPILMIRKRNRKAKQPQEKSE